MKILRKIFLGTSGLHQPRANSSRDPISKITRIKWIVGMSQVVGHLLCKCETLSSNPSPKKTKKVYSLKLTVNKKNVDPM
jgi:hypothetical protein